MRYIKVTTMLDLILKEIESPDKRDLNHLQKESYKKHNHYVCYRFCYLIYPKMRTR